MFTIQAKFRMSIPATHCTVYHTDEMNVQGAVVVCGIRRYEAVKIGYVIRNIYNV